MPVDRVVTVTKEVPVERVVTCNKEIAVDRVVEVCKEVPVDLSMVLTEVRQMRTEDASNSVIDKFLRTAFDAAWRCAGYEVRCLWCPAQVRAV